MNSAFNNQILAEKLRKLNNSQQSIETLSHWCIFHRKKAHLVVETWDKQVREFPKEQQISLLYLANDILQNSRRKGGEFVTEFWKILPGTLKHVMEKGDDRLHTVVFRLVDIWDERKVFGSRSRSLKEELLGNNPQTAASLDHQVKLSHTVRINVPIGGIQEKLASAYQSVNDLASNENATLDISNAAMVRIEALEKQVGTSKTFGEPGHHSILAEEFQEQQKVLIKCAEQLEMNELARAGLVSHLKLALQEQESKLELIQTQLQIVRTEAEHSGNLHQQLLATSNGISEVVHGTKEPGTDSSIASATVQCIGGSLSWPIHPSEETAPSLPVETRTRKSSASVAAEIAAKLAASASSAQMLKSVLSSFVAEEVSHSCAENTLVDAPPEKRQRVNGHNELGQSAEGSPSYSENSLSLSQQGIGMGMPHRTDPLQHPASLQQASSSMQQTPASGLLSEAQLQYIGQHLPTFGYASLADSVQQGQLSVSIHSQDPTPGPFQARVYYGQHPLSTTYLPQQ